MSKDNNKIDINYVKELLGLVDKYNLEELDVEDEGVNISIKGQTSSVAVTQPAPAAMEQAEYFDAEDFSRDFAEESFETSVDDENLYSVTAPLVGVFYSSPSPDQSDFVSVGDRVEVGTELGLIEAMKVFSPIPSEVAGEVVSIEVKSAQLVTEGQVIMKIKAED